jgi:hypothetical protein
LKTSRKSKPRPATKPAAAQIVYNTPLPKKLGVKGDFKVAVLASPKGFTASLKPLPAKVSFTARPEADADLFIGFAKTSSELQAHILAIPATVTRQTLWLAWPKKASGVQSDLDGNIVRTTGLAAGWVDYKVCSIDDTWSGLAFKRRK